MSLSHFSIALVWKSHLAAAGLTLPRPEEPDCPRLRAEKRSIIKEKAADGLNGLRQPSFQPNLPGD
jgi:hypothetical protein